MRRIFGATLLVAIGLVVASFTTQLNAETSSKAFFGDTPALAVCNSGPFVQGTQQWFEWTAANYPGESVYGYYLKFFASGDMTILKSIDVPYGPFWTSALVTIDLAPGIYDWDVESVFPWGHSAPSGRCTFSVVAP